MLEWYRVGWDHRALMRETAELIREALAVVGRSVHVRATTYRALFIDTVCIDPFKDAEAAVRAALDGVAIDPDGLGRDDWLDLVFTHRIQPGFARDELLLVHDYPASQCALAKIRADDPPVAERFEAYLGQIELANGYHELTDPIEQRARFGRDHALRTHRGDPLPPLDERLLAALGCGLPDCAGVAMGVDRLLLAMLDADAIATCLAFPFPRA